LPVVFGCLFGCVADTISPSSCTLYFGCKFRALKDMP
jgi:hypothetical protein